MKDNFQDRLDEALFLAFVGLWTRNADGDFVEIKDTRDVLKDDLKADLTQLFKDYIEAHMPNGMSEDEFSITYTLANDPPEDMADDFTPKQALNMAKSYNQALQQYKSNLLGGLSDE